MVRVRGVTKGIWKLVPSQKSNLQSPSLSPLSHQINLHYVQTAMESLQIQWRILGGAERALAPRVATRGRQKVTKRGFKKRKKKRRGKRGRGKRRKGKGKGERKRKEKEKGDEKRKGDIKWKERERKRKKVTNGKRFKRKEL